MRGISEIKRVNQEAILAAQYETLKTAARQVILAAKEVTEPQELVNLIENMRQIIVAQSEVEDNRGS